MTVVVAIHELPFLLDRPFRWREPYCGDPMTADPFGTIVFSTECTVGFAGGDTNLYRRVGNSPINATDPSGNLIDPVSRAAAGAVIGGAVGAGSYLFQYATGGIQEFSVADFWTSTAGGVAVGAVAGATFGLSLAAGGAVAGGLGLTTGTAGAAVTASVTLGLTGASAGAAGGFVTGVGLTASRGGTAGESAMGGVTGAGRGFFYGGTSGLAAGAVLPFAAMAGIGLGGGVIGGSVALGGSAMVGDVFAQALGNVVGLQRGYDPKQTLFAAGTASIFGGHAGRGAPRLIAFKSGFQRLLRNGATKNPATAPGGPFKGFPVWGRDTVKWGGGAKGAITRAAEITAHEAQSLDAAKVRMAKSFYEGIYEGSLKGNPNAAAKARAELMATILELQERK